MKYKRYLFSGSFGQAIYVTECFQPKNSYNVYQGIINQTLYDLADLPPSYHFKIIAIHKIFDDTYPDEILFPNQYNSIFDCLEAIQIWAGYKNKGE